MRPHKRSALLHLITRSVTSPNSNLRINPGTPLQKTCTPDPPAKQTTFGRPLKPGGNDHSQTTETQWEDNNYGQGYSQGTEDMLCSSAQDVVKPESGIEP